MKLRAFIAGALVAVGSTSFADDKPPYTVVDGNKVDGVTLAGWKTWRAMACERCHGPNQEGLGRTVPR